MVKEVNKFFRGENDSYECTSSGELFYQGQDLLSVNGLGKITFGRRDLMARGDKFLKIPRNARNDDDGDLLPAVVCLHLTIELDPRLFRHGNIQGNQVGTPFPSITLIL